MPSKKKKSTKSKKLINWLRPSSPAKGMLLFALVFAVLGGGYMTYRSFAFTYSNHSATAWSSVYGDINKTGGNGIRQYDSNGGLSSTKVWRLERGATVKANIPVYSSVIIKRSMQACVRFRFTANSGTLNQGFTFTDRGSPIALPGITGRVTYSMACTGNNISSALPGTFTVQIYNNGPADMYIEWISLVW